MNVMAGLVPAIHAVRSNYVYQKLEAGGDWAFIQVSRGIRSQLFTESLCSSQNLRSAGSCPCGA
jgi:hypothetical protein